MCRNHSETIFKANDFIWLPVGQASASFSKTIELACGRNSGGIRMELPSYPKESFVLSDEIEGVPKWNSLRGTLYIQHHLFCACLD